MGYIPWTCARSVTCIYEAKRLYYDVPRTFQTLKYTAKLFVFLIRFMMYTVEYTENGQEISGF